MVNIVSFSESVKLIKGEEGEMSKDKKVGSSNHRKLEYLIKHNPVIQSIYRNFVSFGFRVISHFFAIDKKLVLMNGHGYKYNDSPREIYRKMHELGMTKKYRVVWALNEPEKTAIPGCKKIKMDTWEYFKTAFKAKYWISCVNIERSLRFKKKNQIYLNTWHGASINAAGNAVSGRKDFHWGYIDYFCVCGKPDEINYGRDFEVNEKAFLRVGYPRNDRLYHATKEEQVKLKEKLGLPLDKLCILYAPTWRDSNDGGRSYQLAPPIDWEQWKEELSDEFVVMLRTHPYTTELMNVQFDEFVRDYVEYPEVNDLLIATDILISDYSSINLDYAITEKPMICFGYDYDEYIKYRGFYYDLQSEMPNGVMRDQKEILKHLKTLDYSAECDKTRRYKNKYMEYGGNATLECINTLFGTSF